MTPTPSPSEKALAADHETIVALAALPLPAPNLGTQAAQAIETAIFHNRIPGISKTERDRTVWACPTCGATRDGRGCLRCLDSANSKLALDLIAATTERDAARLDLSTIRSLNAVTLRERDQLRSSVMLVQATLTGADGRTREILFDWNDRNAVRCFAADSDACLRAGGKTLLEKLK